MKKEEFYLLEDNTSIIFRGKERYLKATVYLNGSVYLNIEGTLYDFENVHNEVSLFVKKKKVMFYRWLCEDPEGNLFLSKYFICGDGKTTTNGNNFKGTALKLIKPDASTGIEIEVEQK